MSMTAPLPVLPLRKLLSCSSIGAEQQNRQDVANSTNDSSMKTEAFENNEEQALRNRMRMGTSASTAIRTTNNDHGLAAVDELGRIREGTAAIRPATDGSKAAEDIKLE